jgi:hypothetical protein
MVRLQCHEMAGYERFLPRKDVHGLTVTEVKTKIVEMKTKPILRYCSDEIP